MNLLRPEVTPANDPMPREVELSTAALRERFAALMAAERIAMNEIKSAAAIFIYRSTRTWPDACYVEIETVAGKRVEDAVGDDGRRAQFIRANKRLQATRSKQRAPEA